MKGCKDRANSGKECCKVGCCHSYSQFGGQLEQAEVINFAAMYECELITERTSSPLEKRVKYMIREVAMCKVEDHQKMEQKKSVVRPGDHYQLTTSSTCSLSVSHTQGGATHIQWGSHTHMKHDTIESRDRATTQRRMHSQAQGSWHGQGQGPENSLGQITKHLVDIQHEPTEVPIQPNKNSVETKNHNPNLQAKK